MADDPLVTLAGADRPRPLPPELRARLQDALLAAEVGAAGELPVGGPAGSEPVVSAMGALTAGRPKPVPDATRGLLEATLSVPSEGGEAVPVSGGIAPAARRWAKWGPVTGIAAAVAVALAVGLPSLLRPSQPARPLGAASLGATSAHGKSTASAAAGKLPVVHNSQLLARQPQKQQPPDRVATGKQAGPPPTPNAPRGRPTRATAGPSYTFSRTKGLPSGLGERAGRATVSPDSGPAVGGNWLVLRDNRFRYAVPVTVGAVKAADVKFVAPHELRVLAPAHKPGQVEVVVYSRGRSPKVVATVAYKYR